jgi:YfiH family protein
VAHHLTDTWSERRWAADRALVRRRLGAVMAFGIGPADGVGGSERLAPLVDRPEIGPSTIRWCRQVHGAVVRRVDGGPPALAEVGVGDGLLTTDSGVGLAVWSADCVPVLLELDGVVAAVHAGWRGCAADVVRVAVAELAAAGGKSAAALSAALGPSVCGSCYRVGQEVIAALGRFGIHRDRWWLDDRVDLRGFLAARLETLGVPAGRIESVGGCTVESPGLASFRRDGAAAGRQWSMVFLDD